MLVRVDGKKGEAKYRVILGTKKITPKHADMMSLVKVKTGIHLTICENKLGLSKKLNHQRLKADRDQRTFGRCNYNKS